jgi:predicted TIM-barrel fold metal-dependent hydrolase
MKSGRTSPPPAARFRGIRQIAVSDPDWDVLGPPAGLAPGLYRNARSREGFAQLAPPGLSFDAWMLEPQLADLIDLARAFPGTQMILDHVGTPLGIASYAGRREEQFALWRENIRALAQSANVAVKLGGLATVFPGFPSFMADPPAPSTQLAAEWQPYIETCIEAFGVQRCMFESNFPVDTGSCDYDVLWNAFKVIVADYSADEKTALFSGTATQIYRLGGLLRSKRGPKHLEHKQQSSGARRPMQRIDPRSFPERQTWWHASRAESGPRRLPMCENNSGSRNIDREEQAVARFGLFGR